MLSYRSACPDIRRWLGYQYYYENLIYFNISNHVRRIAWSGVSPAWCLQRRSRLMPSRTHSSNLHVIQRWSALPWGSAVGLKVSARCSDAIRCISCELQPCCCMADVRGGTVVVGALLPIPCNFGTRTSVQACSGVSAARCPQQRSRLMPSRTHSSNLHVI